jgi:hypothetical protein
LAAVLGTTLLGEAFHGGPALEWQLLCEPDFARLAARAADLAARPVPDLRRAIQAIYQDELTHAIDEPPFPEITPAGDLRDRPPAS